MSCVSWVSGVEISRKIPGAWEDFRGMGDMGYMGFHGNRVSWVSCVSCVSCVP